MTFKTGFIQYRGDRYFRNQQLADKLNIRGGYASGLNDKKRILKKQKTRIGRMRRTSKLWASDQGTDSIFRTFLHFGQLKSVELCSFGKIKASAFVRMKKYLKRIILQNKIEALKLYFGHMGSNQQFFSFKGLVCLRSLRNLQLTLGGYDVSKVEKTFQSIQSAAKRRYWPGLKFVGIEVGPKIEREGEEFDKQIYRFFYTIGSISKIKAQIPISLRLNLQWNDRGELFLLPHNDRQVLEGFAHVKWLYLAGSINRYYQYFLKSKKVVQNLKELSFFLDCSSRDKNFEIFYNLLIGCLPHMQALKKVVIDHLYLESNDDQSKKLLRGFQRNFSLTDFAFNLSYFNKISNDLFADLLGTVNSLPNLNSLRMQFAKSQLAPETKKVNFENFFRSFYCSCGVTCLTLQFSDFGEALTDACFENLCQSIKRLGLLKELDLRFTKSRISSEGVQKLTEILPNFVGLEKLNLDLSDILLTSEDALNFVQCQRGFINLSSLMWAINIEEFTETLAKKLIFTLCCNLKRLNYIGLEFVRTKNKDSDIEISAQEIIQSLKNKMMINFDFS